MPRSGSWRTLGPGRRRAQQLGATARTVAQAAPGDADAGPAPGAADRTDHRPAGQHGDPLAESDLREHLDNARNEQDRLSLLLAADPAQRPVGWPAQAAGAGPPLTGRTAAVMRVQSWALSFQDSGLARAGRCAGPAAAPMVEAGRGTFKKRISG
jgi:hypothetical protein